MLAGEDKVCPHHSSTGAVANLACFPRSHLAATKDEERQSMVNSKKLMTLLTLSFEFSTSWGGSAFFLLGFKKCFLSAVLFK